jgi:putative oxidoreductase
MNTLQQIGNWSLTHNPKWLVYFRVILGACLFIRGISFLNNTLALQQLIENSSLDNLDNSLWIALIITWIHLLGGVFISLGLFTRISVWVQIPFVLGAIFLIHIRNSVFSAQSDIIFPLFILVLLLVFAVEGGGQVSMDAYVKKHLL